jgi:predicted TIM-barrel fold metal-dependent hydrolase
MAADTPILDSHIHQWDLRATPPAQSILVKLFGWNPSLLETVAKLLFPKSLLRFFGKIDYATNDYLIEDYRADLGWLASRFFGAVHVEGPGKQKSTSTSWARPRGSKIRLHLATFI